MPIQLDHQNIRNLAKKLRELTGRDIKHTDIIATIAGSVGRRADAMMHELKNEGSEQSSRQPSYLEMISRGPHLPEISMMMMKQTGFEVRDTGGGGLAFAKTLREEELPSGDVASLVVMITTEGGTSIDAGPYEKAWLTRVNYRDPRGEKKLLARSESHLLPQALALAMEVSRHTDKLWAANFDADALT